MIFPRRHWAIRVIRRAGFPVRSREERLLADLLMRASRKNPKELPTAEQVLFAALRMFHSQTAVKKVVEGLAVSPLAAERALAKLPNAAIAVAAALGALSGAVVLGPVGALNDGTPSFLQAFR
jgi:hypothetical protein